MMDDSNMNKSAQLYDVGESSTTSTNLQYGYYVNDVDTEDELVWGSFADSHSVLALYGIICVLGITGNLLVAVVLLRVPSLRTNTSDFLVHLSLVDFLVCVLVIPFKLLPTTGTAAVPSTGFWGELKCRLYVSQFIFWSTVLTSIFSLVTVNLERFVAIVYPLKYKAAFTRRNKCIMIVCCWIFAASSQSFIVFLYVVDAEVGCHFLGWPSPAVQALVGMYSFVVQFTAPFSVMIFTQWKVISKLKRQMTKLQNRTALSGVNPSDQRKMWQLRASQTLIKTLLTFVITFAVCWAPIEIEFLLYNFGVYVDFASPFYHVGVILASCNSCVNPIIYAMMNERFRNGIRKVFRKESGSERVEVHGMRTGRTSTLEPSCTSTL